MKTKQFFSLVVTAAGLGFLAGCASEPGPVLPQDSTKYTFENTEQFMRLDRTTQESITCTGLKERVLPDGRIEVVANVKNRESHPVQIQVNCVFKDGQGFTTGDETPFQTITLAGKSTEAVRFTAADSRAKKFTLRVRAAP